MLASTIREQMEKIRERMGVTQFSNEYIRDYKVNPKFFSDSNLLQQMYGEYLGNAKARHQEYLKEFSALDNDIRTCFAKLVQYEHPPVCFGLINLAIGKISELLSFVESLESIPAEEKVSKSSYDRLLREKAEAVKTAEFLVQYKGLPELQRLIETTNNIGVAVDEYWVLALCSSNLIEAAVNKKLQRLGEKAVGSFRARYQKLCELIKEKESRDLQQLLPVALYEGIRNKLDHASDSNRVTPKEAKDISKMVIEFMNEVFQ